MAYMFNGMGTTCYGKRDFRADGTFLTTEWFVFLFIPLIPFRSIRVTPQGFTDRGGQKFAVHQTGFPSLKQVFYTYGFVAILAAWETLVIYSASCVCSSFPHVIDTVFSLSMLFIGVFVVGAIPVPIPWILRYYAEKRVYDRHDA
jgi:hypothetical protein